MCPRQSGLSIVGSDERQIPAKVAGGGRSDYGGAEPDGRGEMTWLRQRRDCPERSGYSPIGVAQSSGFALAYGTTTVPGGGIRLWARQHFLVALPKREVVCNRGYRHDAGPSKFW